MSIDNILTNAVAEALVEKVSHKLSCQLVGHYGTVLSALSEAKQMNANVVAQVSNLQRQLASQMETLQETLSKLSEELKQNRINNQKAANILNEALKEMGVGE